MESKILSLEDLQIEPYLSISKKLEEISNDNFKLVKHVASIKGVREDVFFKMEEYFMKGFSYFGYVVTLLGEHNAQAKWYELLCYVEKNKEKEEEIGAYIKEIINLYQQHIPYEVVKEKITSGVEVYNLQNMCKLEMENEKKESSTPDISESVSTLKVEEVNSGLIEKNDDSGMPNIPVPEFREKYENIKSLSSIGQLRSILQQVIEEHEKTATIINEMMQKIENQARIISIQNEEKETLAKENFELRMKIDICKKEKNFAEESYKELKEKLNKYY